MQTLFEIVYDIVYNNDDESDNEQEPDEEDIYEYVSLQNYHEGNLLILSSVELWGEPMVDTKGKNF